MSVKRAYSQLRDAVKGVFARYTRAHCALHAAGLTYFSLLAFMPLLCVLLLCAKACGAGDYVREQVDAHVESLIRDVEEAPDTEFAALAAADAQEREERRAGAQFIGRQARTLADRLLTQMDRLDVRTLGWAGCLLLFWTVIRSVGMIELSFNQIWGLEKGRPLWRRLGLYLILAFLLPPLLALSAATPLAKAVKDVAVLLEGPACLAPLSSGLVWLVDSRIVRFTVSTFFIAATFAALYKIIPNCPVGTRNAVRGGLFAAAVFSIWVKICAVLQIGLAKSSALYGSFAFFPLVLTWLYMSWEIILLGAVVVRNLEGRRGR